MIKKALSLLISLLLTMAMILPVAATEPSEEETSKVLTPAVTLQISSVDTFRRFAENCRLDAYSRNLTVVLTTDIDLKHVPFDGIPIFCGTFDGNGHTVSGLSISCDGSALGLFRYIAPGATVKNLTVEGNIRPQGSRNYVGGIAGQNAGTIQNCVFSGTVAASDNVGGIVGSNTVTGIIDCCKTKGFVQGDHFVGGIAGENLGVIRKCTNSAPVNITPQQNSVELSDITLDSLTSSESANTVTDVGGIAGTSGGVIRDCENLADIGYLKMGYNIGGIAGSQMGYMVNCSNFANICGRKEVGGIVGQLEPVAKIEYTTDTLQILQQQLDTMGALAGRASATVQSGANNITGQVAVMQEHAINAKDAVGLLLPGSGGVPSPDMDQLQAARNALSSSFRGMQSSMQSISSATKNTADALSRDIGALTSQINAMGKTLSEAPENLGGSVTDISDLDTPEDLTGKIDSCVNRGTVQADLNGGGIVGAVAPENDLDPEEDVEITGEQSLNFDSELRAVVINCTNFASVTVSKRSGGGITGTMALGLLKNCSNTGAVIAGGAEQVGGIAGQSRGFIRGCYAKASVEGKLCVGGIAGTATVLSDCLSVTQLHAQEQMGAVVGNTEDRTNISANYYFTLETDPGAIDGISYEGCAQKLNVQDFLALENLPTLFKTFTVTFTFADGTTVSRGVIPGNDLLASAIPDLPEKEGYTAVWDGLDGLSVPFDTTVTALYTPYRTVMASNELREDNRPVILAEGSFLPEEVLLIEPAAVSPALKRRQQSVDSLTLTLPESLDAVTVRYLPPAGTAPNTLLYLTASGNWQPLSYTLDGSYYVFNTPGQQITFAAIQTTPIPWLWYAVAAIAVVGIAITVILIKKKPTK